MKSLLNLLAGGYAVLGLIGVMSGASPGLSWVDLGAGVATLAMALSVGSDTRAAAVSGVVGICAGAAWIVALAAHGTPWLAWWTFAFSGVFLLLAMTTSAGSRRLRRIRA